LKDTQPRHLYLIVDIVGLDATKRRVRRNWSQLPVADTLVAMAAEVNRVLCVTSNQIEQVCLDGMGALV